MRADQVRKQAEARALLAQRLLEDLGETWEETDPTIERGDRLRERGDPVKAIYELFGLHSTPDIEKAVKLAEASEDLLAYGAHSTGKTYYLVGAYCLGWRWFCKGCEFDPEDGKPKGGILALLAHTEGQIKKNSWKAVQELGLRARANGWELPGFAEAEGRIQPSWRAIPHRWFIEGINFASPAKASGKRIVASGSGLKAKWYLTINIEEIEALGREVLTTTEGWDAADKKTVCSFNPYSPSGVGHDLVEAGHWAVAHFSYERVPQVRARRVEVPGLAKHTTLEKLLKTECINLGTYPDVEPDVAKQEVIYALPRTTEEDVPGERDDGHLGSISAPLQVFRLSPEVAAGRYGWFPVSSELAVFPLVAWQAAERLAEEIGEPDRPPNVVGVDTAEGGPDRVVGVPRWGPSALEQWERYRAALVVETVETAPGVFERRLKDPAEALAESLRCQICGGEGCGFCVEGKAITIYGRPREFRKTDLAGEMAQRIMAPWGSEPEYRLDGSGGGYSIRPEIELRGAKAICVSFSGGPGLDIEGQPMYLNQRAAMAGKIAHALKLPGAVAIMRDAELRRQARIPEWMRKDKADGRGGKTSRLGMGDKLDIKKALGGLSPDHLDGFILTEGEGGEAQAIGEYAMVTVRM